MENFFVFLERLFFTDFVGTIDLYTILSTLLRFLFVLIVLSFVYSVVRMIVLDLRVSIAKAPLAKAYLKLLNDPYYFDFPIRDAYYLSDNTTIGRADDNSVVLKDPLISKHHAHILSDNGRYYIDDLGSTNVTLVNEVPVRQPVELTDRDIISLGSIHFMYFAGGEDEE